MKFDCFVNVAVALAVRVAISRGRLELLSLADRENTYAPYFSRAHRAFLFLSPFHFLPFVIFFFVFAVSSLCTLG